MDLQEHLDPEYMAAGELSGDTHSPALAKRFGWGLLGSALGRSVALSVCRAMSRHLEIARGTPVLESRNRVVRLWRIEQFREISWSPEMPWRLQDGATLSPDDPVLEFHIAGEPIAPRIPGKLWMIELTMSSAICFPPCF